MTPRTPRRRPRASRPRASRRRVEKPWGYEILWTPADRPYVGKVLHVDAGKRLSLQVHDAKTESWFLMSGRAKVVWDDGSGELVETELQPGARLLVRRSASATASSASPTATSLEVSTPEIGTTHRLEDDYARPDETEAVRASAGRGWDSDRLTGDRAACANFYAWSGPVGAVIRCSGPTPSERAPRSRCLDRSME